MIVMKGVLDGLMGIFLICSLFRNRRAPHFGLRIYVLGVEFVVKFLRDHDAHGLKNCATIYM